MNQVKEKVVVNVTIPQLMKYFINEVETMSTPPFLSIVYKRPFDSWVMKCKEDGTINPLWKQDVTKETTKTYLLVVNYKGRTDNNNKKEGKEEHDLKCLIGKKHISESMLTDIKTESKFYLMVEEFLEIKPSKTIYRHNGNEIDKEVFKKWETYYDSYTNQLSDRKVRVQTLLFSNMVKLTVNGIEFNIIH